MVLLPALSLMLLAPAGPAAGGRAERGSHRLWHLGTHGHHRPAAQQLTTPTPPPGAAAQLLRVKTDDAVSALLATAVAALLPDATAVRSFGTGYTGPVCVGNQTKIFSHNVSSATKMGLMSHFWT